MCVCVRRSAVKENQLSLNLSLRASCLSANVQFVWQISWNGKSRGRKQACYWQRTGQVTQSCRVLTTITGHQRSSSCHATLTFEAPVHFNGRGWVVSLLRLLSEFMSGRNIDCPVTREPRTHGSLSWPVIRVHSFVSVQNCAETALVQRLRTSSPDWADCCENRSDVIRLNCRRSTYRSVLCTEQTKQKETVLRMVVFWNKLRSCRYTSWSEMSIRLSTLLATVSGRVGSGHRPVDCISACSQRRSLQKNSRPATVLMSQPDVRHDAEKESVTTVKLNCHCTTVTDFP